MKKILLFTVMLLANLTVSGQINGRANLVTEDAGNAATNVALLRWKQENRDQVLNSLKNFKLAYNKRYTSYHKSFVQFKKIEQRINELLKKTYDLKALNEKIIYYDNRKKNNNKAIEVINDAITNYANSLVQFSFEGTTPRTILGEILNLRQDLEIYLDEQSRKLDAIKSIIDVTISEESYKRSLIEKYK